MTMHEFSDWLSSTRISQLIQTTSWAIPAIQTVHLVCLAALFAVALVVTLRIAGRGFVSEPLHSVARRFVPAMWILLLILLVSGSLLITAEPGRTITNPVFYTKMSLLAVAASITLWLSIVARRELERTTPLHTVAAVFSMLLWAGIIVAGRYIAYVESY
jgi:uncharacterized membrane protein